jgi:small subunit ribosomal protein S20
MANTKSALKNIRKNKARYLQNRTVVSRIKTLEKKFLSAINEKDAKLAKELAASLISGLEKAKKNNLVHANKVSRKKSRCAELLAELVA